MDSWSERKILWVKWEIKSKLKVHSPANQEFVPNCLQ